MSSGAVNACPELDSGVMPQNPGAKLLHKGWYACRTNHCVSKNNEYEELPAATVTAVAATFRLRSVVTHDRVVVALIDRIVEHAAGGLSFAALESTDAVRLVDAAESVGDVVEFVVDGARHFAESDDHGEDGDAGDENQFRGNDEAGFVIEQLSADVSHGRVLLSLVVHRGWLGL